MEVSARFDVNLVWREKGEHWHKYCVDTKKKKRNNSYVLGNDKLELEGPISQLGKGDKGRECRGKEGGGEME